MNNFEIPIFKGKVMRASAQLQAKYYYGGAETRGPLLYEEKTFYEEAINYYNQGNLPMNASSQSQAKYDAPEPTTPYLQKKCFHSLVE